MSTSHLLRTLAATVLATALLVPAGAPAASAAAPERTAPAAASAQVTAPTTAAPTRTAADRRTAASPDQTAGTPATNAAAKPAKPARPAEPTAKVRGRTATVAWTAPADRGSTITGYVVTPFRDGKAAKPLTLGAAKTQTTVGELRSGSRYAFTVAAKNAVGTGPASRRSAPVQVLAVPTAPTIIALTASNTSALLSWNPPASTGGSPITNYVITPYVNGTAEPPQVVGPQTTGTILGLTPAVTYRFTVAARTEQGTGPESALSEQVTTDRSPTLTFDGDQPAVDVAYRGVVNVTRGVPPFTFTIDSGALPPGLSLNPTTGAIAGTPTAAGSYRFVVRAIGGGAGLFGTLLITLAVTPAPQLVVPAIPLAEVNATYAMQFTVAGGTAPYVYSVAGGTMPPGLSLNPNTGLISGTPTADGVYGLDIRVTDANSLFDQRQIRIDVQAPSVVTLSTTTPLTTFADPATFLVEIGPGDAQGTVTLFDTQPNGVVVEVGTYPVNFNEASFETPLPAFGVNQLRVRYNSTITTAVVFSNTISIEVRAVPGQLSIFQFRQSGIAGPGDQYVSLYNNTTIPLPVAGVRIEAPGGLVITIPPTALPIDPRVGYLVAGPTYSIPDRPADLTVPDLGQGGVRVRVPDVPGTIVDAAGSTPGYYLGSPLATFTSPPFVQFAWVRLQVNGGVQFTGDTADDFRLVSTVYGPINGVAAALGSPSPLRAIGRFQRNAIMQSNLLDPGEAANAVPNQQVVPGNGGPARLVIRRAITNRGTEPVTTAQLRITTLSQANGAPKPGGTPPGYGHLRLINPTTATEEITLSDGRTVTVNNLVMAAPATDPPGGGLATLLTLPFPLGGLAPGQTAFVALTFAIDKDGPVWGAWDVDALGGGDAPLRSAADRGRLDRTREINQFEMALDPRRH